MICPICKTENASNAKFCRNCGRNLAVTPPPPPPQKKNEDDSNSGCLWIIIILVIAAVIGFIIYASNNSGSNNDTYDDTDYVEVEDSCVYEEVDTVEVDSVAYEPDEYLYVSDDELYFDASDGTKTITVNASSSFSISTDLNSWGHTSIDGNTINVWLDDNKSSSSKEDWFEITCGDQTKRINVYQEGYEPSQKATIKEIWVDHGAYDEYNQKGMRIHLKFETEDLKGVEGQVIAYFFYDDETKIKDTNNRYSTPDGQVSVAKPFTPSYDNSTYNDFKLFMPYSELHLNSSYSCYFSIIIWTNNGKVVGGSESNTYFEFNKH